MTIQRVPLLDPVRGNAAVEAELLAACARVLHSGRYILGPEVEAFEAACAKYLQVEHAIGVSSGTDALLMALMALDLKPGDEVICPSFTFFATAGSVWRSGAKPVFVDSRPDTFNLDPRDVERKLTARTRAIMPVHLFGQAADMQPIVELARSRNIATIEDAAQAIGAEYRGKRVGGLGTAGCLSFFPSKNLGGFGDAGLVTTRNSALADKLRMLRTHGGIKTYEHKLVGGNFRIDALQAALLAVKLPHLDKDTAARQAHAQHYRKRLLAENVAAEGPGAPVILPAVKESRHVFNQFVIRVPNKRDALRDYLAEKNIGSAVYYPLPLHLQPCFKALGTGPLPVAEELAREVLAIPIAAELSTAEIDFVCEQLVAFCRRELGVS
ncbi:MAG: DegT/DnrJ/EryC1/StrS family aminotransferase [Deltaproteobacteria bacterium]|nr:DegT/DnrJ/EryC1/StrS family aminotransferase [Deltaproteobacteria bacterium]